jgi:hypothetical protein
MKVRHETLEKLESNGSDYHHHKYDTEKTIMYWP